MTEMVSMGVMIWLLIGLVLVLLGVLWYLHSQYKKERQTHSQELSKLHEQISHLQSAHTEELTKIQAEYQAQTAQHHEMLTQKNNEHLTQLGALQARITALTDEFGQKQLKTLGEHQAIIAQKEANINELKTRLLEQESEFELSLGKAIKEARERSTNAQRHVLKGQISEKFVPFMSGFEYSPADCRFMGEPVDYVVFHRLHECADGQADMSEVSVVFLEVKSGSSRLNKRQQILKDAIAQGRVRFESIRIHESDDIKVIPDSSHINPDKQRYPNSGTKWSEAEDLALVEAFDGGLSIEALMDKHGRNHGGIVSRLKKLGKFQE